MTESSERLVVVYRSQVRAECMEHALILDAAGIDYQLHRKAGEYAVLVAQADEARARSELEAYEQENRDQGEAETPPPMVDSGWTGVLVYWIVLLLVAVLQQRQALGVDWFAAGRMNTGLVREGQWWRCVTALGLHADVVHLLGNMLFGVLFGLFAGQILGSGLAWLSILLAGVLGNALNACIQPAGHTAIGASTALFGALGILSAYEWKRRRHADHRWSRRLVPIVGGVALLAFTGAGDERTDVIAHLTGFASGLMLGTIYGMLGDRVRLKIPTQIGLGLLALGCFALAWLLALMP